MAKRRTQRRGRATDFIGEHLNLESLKTRTFHRKTKSYLNTNIPEYPKPEFHVFHLKHETGPVELERIYRDSGFRVQEDKGSEDEGSEDNFLLWFNLAVGPEEIRSAEKRLLKKKFPQFQEVQTSNNFLWKFATSPAFFEKSLYGSFRFTVPLQDVLDAYSQQFCRGDRPVMRVYRTSVFKQEIQYIVLVHRPDDDERFSDYPLLGAEPQDAVCSYRDGRFIWNSQAMSQTHCYKMKVSEDQINAVDSLFQFYVWDVVSITLHLEPGEVLKLPQDQLGKYITYCPMFAAKFMDKRRDRFKDFDLAENLVKRLWPSTRLNKQTSLQEHFEASRHSSPPVPQQVMEGLPENDGPALKRVISLNDVAALGKRLAAQGLVDDSGTLCSPTGSRNLYDPDTSMGKYDPYSPTAATFPVTPAFAGASENCNRQGPNSPEESGGADVLMHSVEEIEREDNDQTPTTLRQDPTHARPYKFLKSCRGRGWSQKNDGRQKVNPVYWSNKNGTKVEIKSQERTVSGRGSRKGENRKEFC